MGKDWSLGQEFVPRSTCGECGERFYAPPVQRQRGGGKFCSYRCSGMARRGRLKTVHTICVCPICQTAKSLPPSRVKTFKTCSQACHAVLHPPTRQGETASAFCAYCRQATTKGTVYCDQDCYNHMRKQQAKQSAALHDSVCSVCNATYRKGAGSKGLVCSLACWGRIQATRNLEVTYSRGKGGKREDLDNRYFRSRWEANYARYLNWLISLKQIARWEYEPDTFEFVGIKRGTRFYTPDFKVFEINGTYAYHEVKGWMDAQSKTKLRRMAKYHPQEKVIVIDRTAYKSVAKDVAKMLPHWESDPKKGL